MATTEAHAVIRFDCPGCGKNLKAPPEYAGRMSRCPRCDRLTLVPGGPSGAPREVEWSAAETPPGGPGVTDPAPAVPPPPPPALPPMPRDVVRRPGRRPPRATPVKPPEPTDHPAAFVWWQGRTKGRTFPYSCTGCGTTVQLRQRVTQTQRKCPGCGTPITVGAIDKQLDQMEPRRQRAMHPPGCAGMLLLIVLTGVGAMWLLAA